MITALSLSLRYRIFHPSLIWRLGACQPDLYRMMRDLAIFSKVGSPSSAHLNIDDCHFNVLFLRPFSPSRLTQVFIGPSVMVLKAERRVEGMIFDCSSLCGPSAGRAQLGPAFMTRNSTANAQTKARTSENETSQDHHVTLQCSSFKGDSWMAEAAQPGRGREAAPRSLSPPALR
jgi:hypothetical protein